MLVVVVILVVSAALVVGAAWGIWGRPRTRVEGFVIALAGGALTVSAVLELVEPAVQQAPVLAVSGAVLAGAVVYSVVDRWLDSRFGTDSGGGLLAAITLDGVPENLALGVALISANPLQVAALSGSIFLSNLPEAAGGARAMSEGRGNGRVVLIWGATAVLLSASALTGYLLLGGASSATLGLIQAFAGGAVVASLATEVFPDAFDEGRYSAGVAAALGLCLAVAMDQLG